MGESYITRRRKLLVASIALLAVMTLMAIIGGNASANHSSLIRVYADGTERSVNSHVDTVGDALEKVGVSVNEHDLVEPGVDTPVNGAIFRINVYRARPVTVVDGDTVRQVMSPYRSNRLIAADAGIVVYEEDKFIMERVDDIITSGIVGQKLTIIRSTPITVELYGTELAMRTHAETVAAALEEKGIAVKDNDKVKPGLDAAIEENGTIKVVHVGTEVQAREEKIDFPTDTIYDNNMLQGTRKVRTEGKPGLRLVTYEIVTENDKEVSKKALQSVVAEKPVAEVVVVGTRVPDPGSNQAIGQRLAGNRGWEGQEWNCLLNLWIEESQWSHVAENPTSGAYGIPQALPAERMAEVADDWRTNPETQIKWGLNYIAGRYATPCGAWNFFLANNWY